MKREDEPSQQPAAEKPAGKPERRAPPGAGKPAEVVRFEPRPRAEAARPPAAPPRPPPPPAPPKEPDTEPTPLAPPGKQIRLLLGAGNVRYFALPKPVAASGATPAAPAPRRTPPKPPKPAPPAAPAMAPPPAFTAKRVKLTDRDRQLMGLLATTRYLSLEQLHRLVSPGRNRIDINKRTLALAGEGKHGVERPYLKKLEYRNWLGEPQTAWMLTPLGYNVAETVLATPPRRPNAEAGVNFIEHGLFANELYVQLLEAPLGQALAAARARAEHETRPSRSFTRQKAGIYARAAHPGLRWLSHHEVQLPWRQYDANDRTKKHDRVIIPDATLELPGGADERSRFATAGEPATTPFGTAGEPPKSQPGLRCFLEAETGSQTVEPEGDTKPGATLNKLDRYTAYLTGYAGRPADGDYSTWYTKAWPDGYEPTLLFMVKDAGRAAVVTRAIQEWQRQDPRPRINALALTVEGAADWLLSMLGSTWAAAAPGARPEPRQKAPRLITSAEYNVLCGYTKSSHALHQRSRAEARSRGEVPPEYPEETDAMNALLAKLHR